MTNNNTNWCSGEGQFDTRAEIKSNGDPNTRPKAGQQYDVYTLQDYIRDMQAPPLVAKGEGRWIIPSLYRRSDARSHDAQRRSGEFTALVFDADENNYSLEQFENAIVAELGDVERYINSSASSKVDNRKWHGLVPIEGILGGGGYAAVYEVLLERFAARGIKLDAALARTAQLFYTPATVGAQDRDWQTSIVTDKPRLDISGTSLEQDAWAKYSAWKTRRTDAALAQGQKTHSAGMIDWFNNLFTTETLLEEFGYVTDGREWASPRQQASGPRCSTKVRADGSFVSMSGSDGTDGPGFIPRDGNAQRSGDAFDLFTFFRFGNNTTAALNYIRPLHSIIPPNGYFRSCHEFEKWGTATNETLANIQKGIWEMAEGLKKPESKIQQMASRWRLASGKDFIEARPPIRMLVKNVLQRGYLYGLTGQPNHGKTLVALELALCVANGLDFMGNRTKPGNVIYMTAENPFEVSQRLEGIIEHRKEFKELPWFVEGGFSPEKDMDELMAQMEAAEIEETSLIVVDTFAAYFEGEDENASAGKTGALHFVRKLMRPMTQLPGNPTVVVLFHPAKGAKDRDQLIPRGSSAIHGELDGNLTCAMPDKAEKRIEVSYNKIRGRGFNDLNGTAKSFRTHMRDDDGDPVWGVTLHTVEKPDTTAPVVDMERDDLKLLRALLYSHFDTRAKLMDHLGWGEDYRKFGRALTSVKDNAWATVEQDKDGNDKRGAMPKLTPNGKKYAEELAAAETGYSTCA